MDFKSITEEEMLSAVTKFRDAGARLRLVNNPVAAELTYEEMANMSDVVSIQALKKALIAQSKNIAVIPDDPILGDLSFAFSKTDLAGRRIIFSQKEVYLILRKAFLTRKESEAYKTKLQKGKELKAFLDDNKSQKEKIKEATKALHELNLDEADLS